MAGLQDRLHLISLYLFLSLSKAVGAFMLSAHIRTTGGMNRFARTLRTASQLYSSSSPEPPGESFLGQVQQTIDREILLDGSDEAQKACPAPITMILGVSGGCDSVALLHALHSIRKPHWALRAVHFDHQQRGSESDGDRIFVQKLCSSYDVPLDCFYWTTIAQREDELLPTTSSTFSQDRARRWRRSKMMEVRDRQSGKSLLITAHHRDDAEETLLLKMLRGVHLANIQALPALSDDGIWARPLINVRKKDIEEYLNENNWGWREDSSNRSSKYLRNRVRNELIPLLHDLVGTSTLERRLQNLCSQATEIRQDLDERVDESLRRQNEDTFILSKHESELYLTMESFHTWASRKGCLIHYDKMKRLRRQLERRDQRQWTLNVGNGWNVLRTGEALSLRRICDEASNTRASSPVEWYPCTDENGESGVNGLRIQVPSSEQSLLKFSWCPAGSFPWRVHPPWRNAPIRVTDLLRGQKVPLHRRGEAPIIFIDTKPDSAKVVAVYVETLGRWICDADYLPVDNTSRETKCLVLDVGQVTRLMISSDEILR